VPATIRIGTCAWADKGLIERWYPPSVRDAEARLRFYAERFDVVEVDASYYAIPDPAQARRWVERTPERFVFTVKAFGLMTGHHVTPEQLPPDLRGLVTTVSPRGFVEPSTMLIERVFRRFWAALDPLRQAGKLGGVLLQFPPSFAPSPENRARVEQAAAMLEGDPALVEFRQVGWLSEQQRQSTLGWLRDRRLTHVVVDAPAVQTPNVTQTVVAATTDVAYVRFHGRNAAAWSRIGAGAWERFDYYYSGAELAGWVAPLRDLAAATTRMYAMFNTNNADQGPVNAATLRGVLQRAGVDVAPPPGPTQQLLF
jgi:uncharacterized protein YecE (DUF72 family)